MSSEAVWPAIAAVIFDLDGVLTDTAEYHYQAWKRLAEEEGISFTRAQNEQLRGVSRRRSLEILLQGRQVTEEQAQQLMARKNRYYQELIQGITPADLLPGVADLLADLRGWGVRVAVATVSKNARTVLDGLQIWDRIDALSDGYSVQRSKPSPDLFLHAAAQLQVPPSQCLVVEDAAAGIEAAHSAGMHTLALGPHERFAEVRPEAILPSLDSQSWPRIVAQLQAAQAEAATWTVREARLNAANLGRQESLYTVGNGCLGTRGSFEERYPGDLPATLINGLFDGVPIIHTELAAAPDWLSLELLIAGERFSMDQGRLLAYERTLDMRDGVLTRRLRWQSARGHTVELRFERWASLDGEGLVALQCGVTALDFEGDVELRGEIDATVENPGNLVPSEVGLRHWRTAGHGNPEPQTAYLHTRARTSGAELGAATQLAVEGVAEASYLPRDSAHAPGVAARFHLRQGETAVATKLVAYRAASRAADPVRPALESLGAAAGQGYAALLRAHRARWSALWRDCDMLIEGDDRAQRAVRFNLYHLLIAAPRHADRASIPAKTLSGFGYRGHVFWDTDIFIVPFFAFTRPELARSLLLYRYRTLPGARENARRMGCEGARYAWESADDGCETTPRWVPLPNGELARCWCGELELHINADVAYTVWHYWQVTGDDAFMRDYGAEIVLDTASFWGCRAVHNPTLDRYELNDVIGPDEYHEHVNNNAFTNRLVQWHLSRALDLLAWLRREHPAKARDLEQRLGLGEARLAHWQDVSRRLHIPFDPATGLFEQFEGFYRLADLDWQSLEPRTQPVQMVLGIEGANEVQALKQPDVLMMLYLLGDEYDERIKRVNWAYYEPRTDHSYGSSLGPAVHSLLASELGYREKAYRYFHQAAFIDLDDLRGNTRDGIHAAAAGEVWQLVAMGFAGMRIGPQGLTVTPRLPEGWRRVRFAVRYRGRPLVVDVTSAQQQLAEPVVAAATSPDQQA